MTDVSARQPRSRVAAIAAWLRWMVTRETLPEAPVPVDDRGVSPLRWLSGGERIAEVPVPGSDEETPAAVWLLGREPMPAPTPGVMDETETSALGWLFAGEPRRAAADREESP